MASPANSTCRCWTSGPNKCSTDNFQVIKGIKLPRFKSERQHRLNPLQKWAIRTRDNEHPIPSRLHRLISATNGRGLLLLDVNMNPVRAGTPVHDIRLTSSSRPSRSTTHRLHRNENIAAIAPPPPGTYHKKKALEMTSSNLRGFSQQESMLDYVLMTADSSDGEDDDDDKNKWPVIEDGVRIPHPSSLYYAGSNPDKVFADMQLVGMHYFQRLMYRIAADEMHRSIAPSFDYPAILDPEAAESWGEAEISRLRQAAPSDA